HTDVGRAQSDLLVRLAESGGLGVGVAFVPAATGERDLALMMREGGRAPREEHVQGAIHRQEGDQDGGGGRVRRRKRDAPARRQLPGERGKEIGRHVFGGRSETSIARGPQKGTRGGAQSRRRCPGAGTRSSVEPARTRKISRMAERPKRSFRRARRSC